MDDIKGHDYKWSDEDYKYNKGMNKHNRIIRSLIKKGVLEVYHIKKMEDYDFELHQARKHLHDYQCIRVIKGFRWPKKWSDLKVEE